MSGGGIGSARAMLAPSERYVRTKINKHEFQTNKNKQNKCYIGRRSWKINERKWNFERNNRTI